MIEWTEENDIHVAKDGTKIIAVIYPEIELRYGVPDRVYKVELNFNLIKKVPFLFFWERITRPINKTYTSICLETCKQFVTSRWEIYKMIVR